MPALVDDVPRIIHDGCGLGFDNATDEWANVQATLVPRRSP
jgi:hypothetical protein